MGVIESVVTEAEESDSDAEGDDDQSPYPTPVDGTARDPFLNGFDTEHVKLDGEATERILGVAVVISNIFG